MSERRNASHRATRAASCNAIRCVGSTAVLCTGSSMLGETTMLCLVQSRSRTQHRDTDAVVMTTGRSALAQAASCLFTTSMRQTQIGSGQASLLGWTAGTSHLSAARPPATWDSILFTLFPRRYVLVYATRAKSAEGIRE